ncbi:CD339 [Mytilus edulis]|uniref:JAG1 n=1 Tax=Mytilus edulis TaxID=6550 RepID=A0A8S3PVV1_MYTED|nr:CD339 [Mytilus edulis]
MSYIFYLAENVKFKEVIETFMLTFCNICLLVLLVLNHQVYLKEINLIFDGKIVDSQTHVTLSISCSTYTMPFECNMEFLHDNSTVESIRHSDSGCFNQHGKCKTETCACSEDCTSFHWNFTTSSVQTNDSFGCKMRILNPDTNSFFKVYSLVVLQWNSSGTIFLVPSISVELTANFTSARSVINPVNTVTTPSMLTQERSKGGFSVGLIALAIGIVFALSFILTCVCVYIVISRKRKDKNRNEMVNMQMDEAL